jgi:hypothetical protein
MQCPKCHRDTMIQKDNPEYVMLARRICINCGFEFIPIRFLPEDFFDLQKRSEDEEKEATKWIEEKHDKYGWRGTLTEGTEDGSLISGNR